MLGAKHTYLQDQTLFSLKSAIFGNAVAALRCNGPQPQLCPHQSLSADKTCFSPFLLLPIPASQSPCAHTHWLSPLTPWLFLALNLHRASPHLMAQFPATLQMAAAESLLGEACWSQGRGSRLWLPTFPALTVTCTFMLSREETGWDLGPFAAVPALR